MHLGVISGKMRVINKKLKGDSGTAEDSIALQLTPIKIDSYRCSDVRATGFSEVYIDVRFKIVF